MKKLLTFEEIIDKLKETNQEINWENINYIYNPKTTVQNCRLVFQEHIPYLKEIKKQQRLDKAKEIAQKHGGEFVGIPEKSPQLFTFKCSNEEHIAFSVSLQKAEEEWCKYCAKGNEKTVIQKAMKDFSPEELDYINKLKNNPEIESMGVVNIFRKYPADFIETAQYLRYFLIKAGVKFKVIRKKEEQSKELFNFLSLHKNELVQLNVKQIVQLCKENGFKTNKTDVHYTLETHNLEYLKIFKTFKTT